MRGVDLKITSVDSKIMLVNDRFNGFFSVYRGESVRVEAFYVKAIINGRFIR